MTTRPKHAIVAALAAIFVSTSCTSHRVEVDPIEIKPIRVTVDVNVQVQRKLDDFFDFEDELVADDEASSGDAKSKEASSRERVPAGGDR